MVTTRIDDVVAAIVTVLADATGVEVQDGPRLGEVLFETIVVGITDDPDSAPYSVTVNAMQGLGRPRNREDWVVRCLLTVTQGDGLPAQVRSRAVELLELINAAVGDAHVGDAWERARLGSALDWFPLGHGDGATMNVLFSITGSSLL